MLKIKIHREGLQGKRKGRKTRVGRGKKKKKEELRVGERKKRRKSETHYDFSVPLGFRGPGFEKYQF